MDLLSTLGADQGPHGPEVPQCSRKGCRDDAVWQILWNNPKIHTPERRKVWLACDEHRGWLENFLQQRLFWRSTEPLSAPAPEDEQPDSGPSTSYQPGSEPR